MTLIPTTFNGYSFVEYFDTHLPIGSMRLIREAGERGLQKIRCSWLRYDEFLLDQH